MSKGSDKLYAIVGTLLIVAVSAEEKWVWSKDEQRSNTKISVAKPIVSDQEIQATSNYEKSYAADSRIDRLLRDEGLKDPRYEVVENSDITLSITPRPFGYRPDSIQQPYRPTTIQRPQENYALASELSNSAIRRPFPDGSPLSAQTGSVGILTGPVPSWERPRINKNGDPTSFERCKCAFGFNCKSPGIRFGSCDQGKQYCCYNEEFYGSNFGNGIDRRDEYPRVLAGPFRGRYPDEDYRKPGPLLLNQKPALPPYTGLHYDYRSS